MLATGGSAIMAILTLVSQFKVDPGKIIFANMICAPEGLKAMAEVYPQVRIVTVAVDARLNDDKFIVPGLGDYGDRFFNT
jgi:uracil phosphoribosyltransferase